MLGKNRKRKRYEEEEANFWISYSDLMAGILIIFILLFVFKIFDFEKQKTEAMQAKHEAEIIKEELDETKKVVLELSSTRSKIIEMLQEEFENENIGITVDPSTGAIKLKDSILFDTGESELKNEGKTFLKEFIPTYINILLSDKEIRDQIAEIIIEGHTDNVGTYIYNLELSQDRAFSVAEYLLSDNVNYDYKEEFKTYITVNGKSYSDLIYINGVIDLNSSRRVEVKFRLKEEETLLEISRQLEAANE